MSHEFPVGPSRDGVVAEAELRGLAQQAVIAVDAALVAAETLAVHAVVQSLNYERMIDLLEDAQKAVQALQDAIESS